MMNIVFLMFGTTCSFICQGTSTKSQRRDFSVFQSSLNLLLPI